MTNTITTTGRPPLEEVLELWHRAAPARSDSSVAAWILARGLDSADIEDRDLARALPSSGALPAWARSRAGTWRASGHRALFALFGSHGAIESLRARAVIEPTQPAKALSPTGFAVTGLVLADALARLMLADAALGDGSPACELVREVGLVVAEGEPDFATWASRASDGQQDAPAVIGLMSGSWTSELADRVPNGTRVVLRTHHDRVGDRYATQVIETLSGRCALLRGAP